MYGRERIGERKKAVKEEQEEEGGSKNVFVIEKTGGRVCLEE